MDVNQVKIREYSVKVDCGTFTGPTLAAAKRSAAKAQAIADAEAKEREARENKAQVCAYRIGYDLLSDYLLNRGAERRFELITPESENADEFARYVARGDGEVRVRLNEFGRVGTALVLHSESYRVHGIAIGASGRVIAIWYSFNFGEVAGLAVGEFHDCAHSVVLPSRLSLEWAMGESSTLSLDK